MSTRYPDVNAIIDGLGGDVEAAKFFEISRQAVAKFRKQGRLPNARFLHLKAARPDLVNGEQEKAQHDFDAGRPSPP